MSAKLFPEMDDPTNSTTFYNVEDPFLLAYPSESSQNEAEISQVVFLNKLYASLMDELTVKSLHYKFTLAFSQYFLFLSLRFFV